MSILSGLTGRLDPEFSDLISPRAFQRAWQKNGVAKITGFLSTDDANVLAAIVGSAYERVHGQIAADASVLGGDLIANFERWHGLWLGEFLPFLQAHHPEAERELLAFVSKLEDLVSRLFGGAWRFFPERSFFRRLYEQDLYVPWHLDADAARTATKAGRCINIWLPLDPVGLASPSMELILGSHNWMRDKPLIPTDRPDGHRSEEWAETVPGRRWIPTLAAGDAVLFDQYLVHRTQRIPIDENGRASCEFRFTNEF